MIAATEWLADTLIWTGLLIALVLLLRRPVARACGPQFAYALWALPFARLLLPPIVLPASLAPGAMPAAPVMAPAPFAVEAIPDVPTVIAATPTSAIPWAAIALAVWAAGALGFIAWRVIGYRRMRRDLLADARPVGEVGAVRLVETPALDTPVAFGVRDKVVALPLFFMAQPDRAARDLAIAHELSHHRAHDLLANMAAQAVLALHWCNPLGWYGWRAMRQDQEAACDARVVAGRDWEERVLYAALIAGVAVGPRQGAGMLLAAPMACPVLGEASIVQRLRSLAREDASPRRRMAGRLLVGAGALALPLTASISYAAVQADAVAPALPAPPAPPAWPAAPQPPVPGEVQGIDPDAAHEPIVVTGEAEMAQDDAGAWAAFGARMEEFGRRMGTLGTGTEADEARIERETEALEADIEQQFAEGGAMHRVIMRQTGAATALAMASACEAQAAPCPDTAPAIMAQADAEASIHANAQSIAARALMGARSAIAANTALSAAERAEVLAELDAEIADLASD